MFGKPMVLVFLFACHTSSPSVTSGSGTGETPAPGQPGGSAATPPQQNDAPERPPGPPAAIPPVSHPAAPAAPVQPAAAGPGIGEDCGAGDTCAAGLTCVSYYGFAGTQGPKFKSCEVRCETDTACPKGRTCMTVSDGPGRVCR
jgi:hypothetical protein